MPGIEIVAPPEDDGEGCSSTAAGESSLGVLALQGGFEAHVRALEELGAEAREVRVPADLEGLEGLVIPGGESTTITLGVEREGLEEPLRDFVRARRPVLGTCAGMIMLDRDHLGMLDVRVRRNAFGRQLASFEAELEFPDGPLRAVFIRAPWVEEVGDGVEVLARVDAIPWPCAGTTSPPWRSTPS